MTRNGRVYTVCGHAVGAGDWARGFCGECPPASAWPGLCAAGRALTPPADPDLVSPGREWNSPCIRFTETLQSVTVRRIGGEDAPHLLCGHHAPQVLTGMTADWLILTQAPVAPETTAWQAQARPAPRIAPPPVPVHSRPAIGPVPGGRIMSGR